MTFSSRLHHSSPVPEELSHLSFGNIHHQETMSDPPYLGATLPLPPSSAPTPSTPESYRGMPSPSLGYIIEELPQETISYTTGQPLQLHYLLRGEDAVDLNLRCYVATAAKSIQVNNDKDLRIRRNYLLGLFADSFPAEVERMGKPYGINTLVYDHFTGIERRVANTMAASRVAIIDQKGMPSFGYFIQPGEYRTLYNLLNGIRVVYAKAVQDLAGITLVLPRWARNDIPSQVWSAADFEIFAIKYREELETFLFLCYTYRHAESVMTSNPSRRDRRRQVEQQQESFMSTIEEQVKDPQRRTTSVPLTPAVHHPSSPLLTQDRRVPQTGSIRGYTNNPAGLSGSRRLSELIGPSIGEEFTSTPVTTGPGPNLTRQVLKQFQHHSYQTSDVIQQPVPHYPAHASFNEPPQGSTYVQQRNTQPPSASSGDRELPIAPYPYSVPSVSRHTPITPNPPTENAGDNNQETPHRPPAGGPPAPGGGGPPGGGPPGGGGSGPHRQSNENDYRGRNSQRNMGAGGGPPGDDPPDDQGPLRDQSPPPRLPSKHPRALSDRTDYSAVRAIGEFHFDRKLKQDIVPFWDGNGDTLGDWITTIDDLADRGKTLYTELGQVVPLRLKGDASTWFWSMDKAIRRNAMRSWGTLKHKICEFYMNRPWMDKQKVRSNRATYREAGHPQETPIQYVIRKLKLLKLVYEYTDSQLIVEIMSTAPQYWNQVIDSQRCADMDDFMSAVKYHEDALTSSYPGTSSNLERRIRQIEASLQRPMAYRPRPANRNFGSAVPGRNPMNANTNLVGYYPNMEKPRWPRDDTVISKGKTPEDAGARPCRHCGSPKHWDYDCPHARKGAKQVKVNFANPDNDYVEAQEAYDSLYYEDSEEEDEEKQLDEDTLAYEDSEENQSGFRKPLQRETFSALHVNPDMSEQGGSSRLGGLEDSSESSSSLGTGANNNLATQFKNRREKRTYWKQSMKAFVNNFHQSDSPPGTPIFLKKYMARPPGCSFLGAKATTVTAYIGGKSDGVKSQLISDSGSDITLISHKLLNSLPKPPRIHSGERINLIQVTGSATLGGYVTLPLEFETNEGAVIMEVEAYVVKGMNTPFILGNDFGDQYQLSLVRKEEKSFLTFGDTGRQVEVYNSLNPSLVDEMGHTFRILVQKPADTLPLCLQHKHSPRKFHDSQMTSLGIKVVASEATIIPPETVVKVPVTTAFPKNATCLFVDRVEHRNRNLETFFGAPASLINKDDPFLQIANFTPHPVTIQKGRLLGWGNNPDQYLDSATKKTPEEVQKLQAHSETIKTIVNNLLDRNQEDPITSGQEEDILEGELKGGPKTAEVPDPDPIPTSELLSQVNFSPDLTEDQRKALEEVVLKNKDAFGLDGRLGHYDAKVQIPLRENAKEVSLPPFPVSPEKRAAIDKQMDAWISNGVIEPSKSPWGFPAFIVYRNNKPRMVIDYRKLNAMTIPDEFPLPRQDEILQALTGSQWLSTFDALAGFTQLEIAEEEREKTAFRTHRGLWQFKRMPFGLRNGPSIFQRVTQTVLAPYLWLFTLVYIDDIIVYSLVFKDHVWQIDTVLYAIRKNKLTLSPPKCFLGYRALLLLGQKVSRLGLSTHKEKIDAIRDLAEPRNVHELQVFLGMMVYFSAYIPFYAWIVAPLFTLLRKGTPWQWTALEQEAFNLSKEALVNAPVRAYAIPGLGYRLYSDACDIGVACILQQVQPIAIKDLKGTSLYTRLQSAYNKGLPVPQITPTISRTIKDVPENKSWSANFEDTEVHIERVIAYWSRSLKSAERNYSPTEREAMALKDGLIRFQPYIEGEKVIAITDHAALIWSKTFQNVNRRLLTWGTVFSAYPDMEIVHRAGRVHSNVDPISRLRRRTPYMETPLPPDHALATLNNSSETLSNFYRNISPQFEERVLQLSKGHIQGTEGKEETQALKERRFETIVPMETANGPEEIIYSTARTHSLQVQIADDEIEMIKAAYQSDLHFGKVFQQLHKELEEHIPRERSSFPQYSMDHLGLIYFRDWSGNLRLCIGESKRNEIISMAHDSLVEGAHSGYHRTYNRIAAYYYWPRMALAIRKYVQTCDVCQKIKHRKHAPYGYLQPLPIPNQPFETITMDFITELPESNSFDAILVVIDKLTKYGIFIPVHTNDTAPDTARVIYREIIAHYGIPREIVSDRDRVWSGQFWKEVCSYMNIKRLLSTAYHPQTDGQTENLNQTLEIALRAYINEGLNNWAQLLAGFTLSYNNTVHSSTGFTPAFLLRGFNPRTPNTFLPQASGIDISDREGNFSPQTALLLDPESPKFTEEFLFFRNLAKDTMKLAQSHQEKYYNNGHLLKEFNIGDLVLLNLHSMNLLRGFKGRGRKLLPRFDGPFEILDKVSDTAYRLRLPASYQGHPVINIAHLEPYHVLEETIPNRPKLPNQRQTFEELEEFEVERIIDSKVIKGPKGRRIRKYRVRWKGYSPRYDTWESRQHLRNAPEALREIGRAHV